MTLASMESGENPGQRSARMQALPQIIAVNIKNIVLFVFGCALGFPTLVIPGVLDPHETFNFDDEGLSWIGSIVMICVPVGCIISGSMSQALGRRRAMQIVNIPFITGWLLFAFSNREWHIYLALTIFGLTGGSLEAPILTYVAEVTQPHLRGILGSISVAAFFIGIMATFVLGMLVKWRTVAFICTSFHVVSFVALFFIPESPHWLIQKGRFDDAKASLAWLRGWVTPDVVDEEYKQIYAEVTKTDANSGDAQQKLGIVDTLKLFLTKSFLWPYCIVSLVFLLSHFSGMSPLLAYAVPIFNTLKVPMDEFYATGMMGIVQILGCIPNTIFIHVWGKRVLNFISLIAMGICSVGIATYAYIENIYVLDIPLKNSTIINATIVNSTIVNHHNIPEATNYSWIPLTLLITFTFFAHVGIKLIPWVLVAEVFTTDLRAAATGICSATTYIMNFVVNKTFFSSVKTLTFPGVFWMYACVAFTGCGILYYVMPETEGKTLSEIGDHFAGGADMGIHVYRGSKENKQQIDENGKKRYDMGEGVINKSYAAEEKW